MHKDSTNLFNNKLNQLDKNYDNKSKDKFNAILEPIGEKINYHLYYGLPDSKIIKKKVLMNDLNHENFYIENVEAEGNCGFRAISLQIYNDENNHQLVRSHIYNYLNQHKVY